MLVSSERTLLTSLGLVFQFVPVKTLVLVLLSAKVLVIASIVIKVIFIW